MYYKGKWTQSDENLLNKYKTDLEELKVKYYQIRLDKKQQELIKSKLKECKEHIGRLLARKAEFDHTTCEYTAELHRDKFLIGCSLFINKKRYWKNPLVDYKTKSDSIIDYVLFQMNMDKLSENDVRKIVRSDEWRSYWACKYKILSGTSTNLPDELRDIIVWSIMYDSIHKHPESPEDSVFEDDDKLDGWLILQRRKTEKTRIENKAAELAAKHGNAGEIFVTREAQMSVDEVTKMNDTQGRQALAERFRVLQEKEQAYDWDFNDVRQEIQMAINRGGMRTP